MRRFETQETAYYYKKAILKSAFNKSCIANISNSFDVFSDLSMLLCKMYKYQISPYEVSIQKLKNNFLKIVFSPFSYFTFILKDNKIYYITVNISNHIIPFANISILQSTFNIPNIIFHISESDISNDISEIYEATNIFNIMTHCNSFQHFIIFNNTARIINVSTDFMTVIQDSISDFDYLMITTCYVKPHKIIFNSSHPKLIQIIGSVCDYISFL
jgi:hypothetical protein